MVGQGGRQGRRRRGGEGCGNRTGGAKEAGHAAIGHTTPAATGATCLPHPPTHLYAMPNGSLMVRLVEQMEFGAGVPLMVPPFTPFASS